MTVPTLLSRQQLTVLNKRSLRYALDVAEKDYHIALALALLADSPLSSQLVFKGGTALHHCYLPQYRFSEDIDFSTLHPEGLTLEAVTAVLEHEKLFEVRKKFVSDATIKIERLRYAGVLAQPGAIKVEIDYFQNVVLPPQQLSYRNAWGLAITVPVMDIREICAEKLRAASQRARYRDFYDLYLIFEQFQFDMADILALVRRKEVRYPITSDAIKANWRRSVVDLRAGKDPVQYTRAIAADELEQFIAAIHFDPIRPTG